MFAPFSFFIISLFVNEFDYHTEFHVICDKTKSTKSRRERTFWKILRHYEKMWRKATHYGSSAHSAWYCIIFAHLFSQFMMTWMSHAVLNIEMFVSYHFIIIFFYVSQRMIERNFIIRCCFSHEKFLVFRALWEMFFFISCSHVVIQHTV